MHQIVVDQVQSTEMSNYILTELSRIKQNYSTLEAPIYICGNCQMHIYIYVYIYSYVFNSDSVCAMVQGINFDLKSENFSIMYICIYRYLPFSLSDLLICKSISMYRCGCNIDIQQQMGSVYIDIQQQMGWVLGNTSPFLKYPNYRQVSNRRRTKSQHLKDSRTVLQLSLPYPLKPDVKSRMKM